MATFSPTYWRHLAAVFSGAVLAQAFPILAAPLITRLCGPAELGQFSLWFGVVGILSLLSTLRLEAAMFLEVSLRRQRLCLENVMRAAATVALLASAAGLLAVLLRWAPALQLSWPGALTLGTAAWLTAYLVTWQAYASAHSAFELGAKVKVAGSAAIVVAQLALLALYPHGAALVVGHVMGLVVAIGLSQRLLPLARARLRLVWQRRHRVFLRRHERFWKFALPSSLLNSLVSNLPLFLIGVRFGAEAAGLYALTQRVLYAPVSLVASSVLEVFKRQCAEDFRQLGNCRATYRQTAKLLAALGCLPCLILLLAAPQLFCAVFGDKWWTAGELGRLMAPLYFLNFVASPLSYVFFIVGRQKQELRWQCALMVMTLGAFLLADDLFTSVTCYTLGYSTLYLVYLGMSYHCACNRQGVA
jgi:O-antigen/teichoic acid export membrane protein